MDSTVTGQAGTNAVKVERSIRQGGPYIPKAICKRFGSRFEHIIIGTRLNINGEYTAKFRFSDSIVLFSDDMKKLEDMILESIKATNKLGLIQIKNITG